MQRTIRQNTRVPAWYWLCLILIAPFICACSKTAEQEKAAEEVIARFLGEESPVSVQVKLSHSKGLPTYQASLKDGVIDVQGNTPVALCKGFYDLVRSQNAGMTSWSGQRFDVDALLSGETALTASSPYAHHFMFNVVTYGYSMPYWDEARWDKEIDLMALHGYDMPLMQVAQEAIMRRMFSRFGLTEDEIENFFTGPAHLPWLRMGNISCIDGPLTAEWHEQQLSLAHHIMDRMHKLGMEPICPAFAGFVPQGISRVYPDVAIVQTSWSGGAFHNWMVAPDQPLFQEMGKAFIEEWEKEFGRCKYYLADSFNEMDIPFADHGTEERYRQLAGYGKALYESIANANPEAVWTMQGWMFGYQRHIWDKKSLDALLSEVPDEKMLLLDLAVDYNYHFWHTTSNWEFYEGFSGKPWVFSVIPNMGGKSAYTGILDFYANQGRLDALHSPNRGHLVGYGYAGEGLENNELLYELIADGGWTADSIDVEEWLTRYQICRYGRQLVPNQCWRNIYSRFTDHPSFSWQHRPGTRRYSTVHCANEAQQWMDEAGDPCEPLAKADYAEMYSMAIGAKIDTLLLMVDTMIDASDYEGAKRTAEEAFMLMEDIDERLKRDIPSHSLDVWLDYARRRGTNSESSAAYVSNARRIVTIWGPPVDDYSCRMWSGLIQDYYLQRWKIWLDMRLQGKEASEISAFLTQWEKDWVKDGNTND